jgi:uncharacterized membrane protein YfcA
MFQVGTQPQTPNSPFPAMLAETSNQFPLVSLVIAFFLASLLYSSVGHGGASAYLAVMGLVGMAPVEMKPIALTLNIAVSAVAMISFARAGHFRSTLFWPLAIASVPAAFLGGWLQSPDHVFKLILAAALIFGAWRLIFRPQSDEQNLRKPQWIVVSGLGLAIGFLSGLIGIGGGIFLTPLLILFKWNSSKTAAAVSAAFIFVNSLAGLGGFAIQGGTLPMQTALLLPATIAGGWLGSCWGSRSADSPSLQRVLAAVLIMAAAKFIII